MKRSILMSLCLVWGGVLMAGHANGADLPEALKAPMEEYSGQEKELDGELQAPLQKARDAYVAAVEAIAKKAKEGSDEARVISEELNRFKETGGRGTPDTNVPKAVADAWKAYDKECDRVAGSLAGKRKAVRSAYLQKLQALEKEMQAKGDTPGLATVKQAKEGVQIRNRIEAKETVVLNGSEAEGRELTDVAVEGGYLVGFDFGVREWTGYDVFGRCLPIYATAAGLKDGGMVYGIAPSSRRIVAREGYAVGGLMVQTRITDVRHVIARVQIIFMKIKPDGLSLDPEDTYGSPWLGNVGNGETREIDGGGKMIVGLKCRYGWVVDRIALVALK